MFLPAIQLIEILPHPTLCTYLAGWTEARRSNFANLRFAICDLRCGVLLLKKLEITGLN